MNEILVFMLVCFVNYVKVFVGVYRNILWKIMESYGILLKFVRMVNVMYGGGGS